MKKYSRNEFLKTTGLSLAGAAAIRVTGGFPDNELYTDQKLILGLTSYTFRNFSLDDTIKMTLRLNLGSISLKSMHMPLESSDADIRAIAEKIRKAGLELYGAGVIYMKTAPEVETAFAYANSAGLKMIIGVPNHELLPLVNEKVKKYNIKLAIHNHGPGDTLYSSPDDVFEKIKDLDRNIGFCIDIGHVERIGQDPSRMLEKYKDRLYDIHMKDVDKATGDGVPVEIGRGVINIPKVIKTLNKIRYRGVVAFEYEKDGEDPMPGLAESVGYLRGIMKMS